MQSPVLEIKPNQLQDQSVVWSVELDGKTVASAMREELALVRASSVLNYRIVCTSGALTIDSQIKAFQGAIDFARAKTLVAAQQLWLAEHRLRNDVEIVDEDCVEYEWGWVMHYRPTTPYADGARRLAEYHFPFLVDRVTGITGSSGGTKGLRYGIVRLLQKRPRDLCGQYPYAPDEWWFSVYDKYERLGALEPIPQRAR